MPTYLLQSQWTDQGIRNVKESVKRLDLGKKKLKEMGGEIKAFYLTTGPYDMLAIVDVLNDAVLAEYLLWLGSQGNIRTQTVRAFTEDEFRRIVGGLT
ncbi:GYD family protein [Nitrospira sp. KM1]|uniref:GYD domain-containing protein n=1 Tax=Nitrospira sp. KM1 TaxID=1936990 RepID=UPI0013A73799|nr:GYD domain-containing protein [Nitrospira sp. KM1]BCA53762.1 GYD family protein [Nitrospira sp. KM1]